jgi:hypothetical protein
MVGFDTGSDFIALADVHGRQFVIGSFSGSNQNVDPASPELLATLQLGPSRARKRDPDARPVQEFDDLGPFWIAVRHEDPAYGSPISFVSTCAASQRRVTHNIVSCGRQFTTSSASGAFSTLLDERGSPDAQEVCCGVEVPAKADTARIRGIDHDPYHLAVLVAGFLNCLSAAGAFAGQHDERLRPPEFVAFDFAAGGLAGIGTEKVD